MSGVAQKRSLLLDALLCQNHSGRPPVWLMRQAGRYMPEYRELRKKYSFMEMCHNPEISAEVTLQPIKAFDMDAAIIFSDILVTAEALGVGVHFEEGRGPVIERPLNTINDVAALPKTVGADSLSYVAEAIRKVKGELKVPLIGFCGAPFTVASYMIEGGSSKTLKKTKRWMLQHPESFHTLLTILADLSIEYLLMQADAGADALQIFDSWANSLAYPHFQQFSHYYLKRMVEGVASTNLPVILFCRGSAAFAPALAQAGPAAVSVDWNCDLRQLRKQIPSTVALQGNLDPDILLAPQEVIVREVKALLRSMDGDPGYIFNLGHGVTPDVPTEAVKTLVETVKAQ